ncbi:unnamed protein product, partial [Gongylonema pulchrum]
MIFTSLILGGESQMSTRPRRVHKAPQRYGDYVEEPSKSSARTRHTDIRYPESDDGEESDRNEGRRRTHSSSSKKKNVEENVAEEQEETNDEEENRDSIFANEEMDDMEE